MPARISVSGGGRFAYFEPPSKERQRQPCEHYDRKQVKTIHERKHRRLLIHHVADQSVRLMGCIRSRGSAGHQEMARGRYESPYTLVGSSQMTGQHALMILRAPLEHGGNERDAEACAPVTA